MLNDNYIEDDPVKVDSDKCKNNPSNCCYEVSSNGSKANIGFMCKKGTCNHATGICDIGKPGINKLLGSLYSDKEVEGYSEGGCKMYRNVFWLLILFITVLLYFIYLMNNKLKMLRRK